LGWTEEAIYDALTVTSVFKFYNTWNNGSGVQNMTTSDYLHSGHRLISMGYCMDFTWRSILRVMWVGRKEIKYHDLKQLLTVTSSKLLSLVRGGNRNLANQGTAPAASAPPLPS
jgi:hypothetical protein